MALVAIRFFLMKSEEMKKSKQKETNLSETISQEIQEAVVENVDSSARNNPEFTSMEEDCSRLHQSYSSIKEIEKKFTPSLLFTNIHKQIDGKVYRLRFFFKDGTNGEIPTFLVYEEDQNEEELIIENTAYKKGPLYLKVERSLGENLYEARGYELAENDAFIHYENGKLKDLQGDFDFSGRGLIHLECRY